MERDMTSHERVMAAFDHRPPDRAPTDYWAWHSVTERLKNDLNVADEEELLRTLGVDLRNVRKAVRYVGPETHHLPDGRECGIWGVPLNPGGTYASSVTGTPLAPATTVAEIENHEPFPDPDWFDYSGVAKACREHAPHAIMGGDWSPFFCRAMHMMGMQELLEAMALYPEVAEALMTRITDYYLESSRRQFEAADGGIDIFFMGDDYGGQTGPLISLKMFRKFIKPHLARLFKQAHDYDIKVMLHSCGSIYDFIPDLIDIGMDALDPIQVRAKDMQMELLAREFGDDIVLHGSIDTQHTLPFGTAEDVRAEVRARLGLFTQGGFICAPSQEFIDDISTENIVAMYDEVGSFQPGDTNV
ncbi:MAG: uroporphyrinogen decarboxylase family protein [Armatimonadota bacterium]